MVDHLHAREVFEAACWHNGRLIPSRRLAAATGNPVGILDDNIGTSPPFEAPGFSSVSALVANVQLARMTGMIIQSTAPKLLLLIVVR